LDPDFLFQTERKDNKKKRNNLTHHANPDKMNEITEVMYSDYDILSFNKRCCILFSEKNP